MVSLSFVFQILERENTDERILQTDSLGSGVPLFQSVVAGRLEEDQVYTGGTWRGQADS